MTYQGLGANAISKITTSWVLAVLHVEFQGEHFKANFQKFVTLQPSHLKGARVNGAPFSFDRRSGLI